MKKHITLFALLAIGFMSNAQMRTVYVYIPGDGEHQFGLSVAPTYGAQQFSVTAKDYSDYKFTDNLIDKEELTYPETISLTPQKTDVELAHSSKAVRKDAHCPKKRFISGARYVKIWVRFEEEQFLKQTAKDQFIIWRLTVWAFLTI